MAATPSPLIAAPSSATQAVNAQAGAPSLAESKPLWRFALVGLGPLTALALFGLLVALFQHVA